MEHCPSPIYGMIYRFDLYNLQVREKHLKNDQEGKIVFPGMSLLHNLLCQHCPKIQDGPLYDLKIRLLQSKNLKKGKNVHKS